MKLLVVDGNSLINRSFYAIHSLSSSNGEPTNAIYGFLRVLNNLLKEINPDGVAVAFDLKGPTFRHEMYSLYKSNRKGMPDELAQQMEPTKESLRAIGARVVEQQGYEADDIMGALSVQAKEQGWECILATGDRDALQLIQKGVEVWLFKNQGTLHYDEEKFVQEFGVTPKEYIDVKALMGDSSDCIPGVRGIGQKTAFSLIAKYHNLDEIFKNIQNLDATTKIKTILQQEDSLELAKTSRELATIVTDLPIETDMEFYRWQEPDLKALRALFQRLDLYKLYDMFKKDCPWLFEKEDGGEQISAILNPPIAETLKMLEKSETVDFIWEEDKILLSTPDGIVCYREKLEEVLKAICQEVKKPIRTYEAKKLYRFCLDEGILLPFPVFSADIAAYLLDPQARSYELSTLLNQYRQSGFPSGEYGEISAFPDLCDSLMKKIEEENMQALFQDVETPLCEVLASMEKIGFLIDKQSLNEFGEYLHGEIEKVSQEIYIMAGETFNINSTVELGEILFEKLELPRGKKSKSGRASTGVEVLEKLEPFHPIIGKIISYRKCNKLYSTYVKGMAKLVQEDGRIHSIFQQTETRTGRISSKEPNVQNIPVRTELGSRMREFFVAGDGMVLIDADYSQIELRVLAHLSQDERMLEVFHQQEDIHTITASEVFHIAPVLLPPQLRYRAKAINFGIVYGMSAFGLAKDLNISNLEAQEYIKKYFATYRGVERYMKKVVDSAIETGEVHTLFGRIRKIPELSSKNMAIRNFGIRAARNTPIQGTAADIIKIAMIKVYHKLREENMQTRLVLQVHDELILEAPQEEAEHAMKILKEEMESAVKLSVPLKVDISMGKSWKEAKG